MIIKRLTMHNFGVYASTNTLEFNGKKPVVLIGGMNGRGKTTILEAVLLSLYGSNSFAYTESKYTTYGQYLKSYINKTDGSLDTFVEIEFAMDKSNDEIYTVRRDWDGKGQRVKERITVLKNGEENKFLTENWSMFVENILPSALSNFFFFDGEKIAKLAVEETSEQMKESIKAMLGITVLDVLQGDIGKIINKISKNIAGNQDLKKLEELRSVKETAEQVLEEADVEIEGAKLKLEELQLELEQLNTEYSVKGGGILEQKNALMKLYRIRLQERKTDILAQTMTECYKKLANKKNLVDCIKMDPETLDLQYLNADGEEIAKKRLSAGEKQLMVISLLWALAICSKKKLPVIIDTPLSRLDSSHRQALIKTYFPSRYDNYE